ncbi:hypothetical protein BpHYR1_036161 [Brachionus plicatilis]|uniref:Uncharacterized protein n=1 Tax=Brachionus plicatilis TaxID=10195 RepID=A0A3M7SSY0_BRAPC|nr:hypothetical protein BpHYR1_036161 [Brachionus plicatilis]
MDKLPIVSTAFHFHFGTVFVTSYVTLSRLENIHSSTNGLNNALESFLGSYRNLSRGVEIIIWDKVKFRNKLVISLPNHLDLSDSNFIDSNPQMVSPVLKRRNESFVWQYMKKYENKIICQVINCSAEFSIKTSSSSKAVHLANIHEKKIRYYCKKIHSSTKLIEFFESQTKDFYESYI